MKRLYLFVYSVFLVFIISCTSVYASSNYSENSDDKNNSNIDDPSGMDAWSLPEKVVYWGNNALDFISAVLRIPVGGSSSLIDKAFTRYSNAHSGQYDSYTELLASGTSFNDDSKEFVFDNSVLEFLNYFKELVEEDAYQYGYFPTNAYISTDSFKTKGAYNIAVALISKYPDKVFRFNTSSVPGMAGI